MFNAGPGPLVFSVDSSSTIVYASLGAGGDDVQWGAVTPVYGSIPAQEGVIFTLLASSVLLPPGAFAATVVIHTNQPSVKPPPAVDQPISFVDGHSFSFSWNVRVVEAIAIPGAIDAILSPLQAPLTPVISVANLAGAVLVVAASSNVSWVVTEGSPLIVPVGALVSFPVALYYPMWDSGSLASVVDPGSSLTALLHINCWRAVECSRETLNQSIVPMDQLAALLNASVDNFPNNNAWYSPVLLNPVEITVSTDIGPPNATLSTVELLSPASINVNGEARISIRVSL